MSYSFDGGNRRINLSFGTTYLDMKDLYSRWKEWVIASDNSKYLNAFLVVGGEVLPGDRFLGTTYFLENGWRIKPYEGSHTLVVTGNIYTREGTDPFVSTQGNYNVRIMITVSNLIDTVSTSGGGGGGVADWTDTEKNQIRYRLGIDGETTTPTLQPNLDIGEVVGNAVRDELQTELTHLMTLQNGAGLDSVQSLMLLEIYRLYGLDPTKPLIVSTTHRVAGNDIVQTISTDSDQTTTVTRQ